MTLNNHNPNGADNAGTTGTAGIPAGANFFIPPHIIKFCHRLFPPHLGSDYDLQRAQLIAKRLAVEGFPVPGDIATFMATPAFLPCKQTDITSATNVDSQSHPKNNDPLQSATDPLQTATDAQPSASKPQPNAPHPQQPTPNPNSWAIILNSLANTPSLSNEDLQLIADDYHDLLDKRSKLDQLTLEQQDAICILVQKLNARDVSQWLAQPSPIGLGLKIHFTNLSRFVHRHADRKRILAQREKIQLAEQIVNAATDKDDGYSNAAIRLLHGRVLKATADDNTDPEQLKLLTASLNALRKQTLAERKFASQKVSNEN